MLAASKHMENKALAERRILEKNKLLKKDSLCKAFEKWQQFNGDRKEQ